MKRIFPFLVFLLLFSLPVFAQTPIVSPHIANSYSITTTGTYGSSASGNWIDSSVNPIRLFDMQIKGTGGTPAAWNISLEGTTDRDCTDPIPDNILTHVNGVQADGVIVATSRDIVIMCWRVNVNSLTLAPATAVKIKVTGFK